MSSIDENDMAVSLGVYKLSHPEPGEEVVISGLSGRYPDSDNVEQFRNNLFNKMYLSGGTHRLWKLNNSEAPPLGGRMRNIDKFDAGFFGVHSKQAHCMDPLSRLLTERSFEAVLDAGINPNEIKGTNTGVFIAACFSEAEENLIYKHPQKYSLSGCVRSSMPYRISQALGVNGPSYVVDSACSSSMYAVEQAYRAIRTGVCDAAIVGGCILCLNPFVTLQFWRLGVLNSDGKCKCFDETADGYTRSEASVAIVLQKSKSARRIYAQLVHAKTNCDGYKEQGITYPSAQIQTKLLNEFYIECEIDPRNFDYIEAHGTGTRVGDPEEVASIDSVFCKNRSKPLLIGSVKSNIGHSEGTSGLCSISKAIFSMESGYLIPNIHFNKPRDDMLAIVEGRIKVVTEVTPWKGGYMPVSSFGFGGANCHVLLKSNTKEKINNGLPDDDLPRLVYVSGRTEEAVDNIINDLEKRTLDAEYVRLLQDIFKENILGHIYRGYAILSKEALLARQTQLYSHKQRELWYIFSGLSSQWSGMGEHLLTIPAFAATIERCHQVLMLQGLNIFDIIKSKMENKFANITNTLVGITAIQIGLADLLTALDLKPTGTIGHSIGEIACAYYNKCLTLEQAILCSYHLGQCITKFKTGPGLMLSVNAGFEKIKPFLTKDIEIACCNSENNCILSGSYKSIKELQTTLTQHGINSHELKTNDTALHSTHMEHTGRGLIKKLSSIIGEPKLRPESWLSSSVPNPIVKHNKYCCAEYFSNMICSPVLFKDIYNKISEDNVIMELSPHGNLQNINTCSDNNDFYYLRLIIENSNNVELFLHAIGKLYLAGFNPHVENIYPKINYPVSRGTPMLSHLVKWDHSQNWYMMFFDRFQDVQSGEFILSIEIQYEEFEFISGHNIDERILFPATGYLKLVWDAVALIQGQLFGETSMVFENVKFLRATHLTKGVKVILTIRILKASGYFEVVESNSLVATGLCYIPKDIEREMSHLPVPSDKHTSSLSLSSRDAYKEMRLRGYNYKGIFRSLHSVDLETQTAQIKWQDNYVVFMDNMLQMQLMFEDTRSLFVPTAIERICIDTKKHSKFIENLPEDQTITAYTYKNIKTVICGGIEIKNVSIQAINRRKPLVEPVLATYKFIPSKIENIWSLSGCVDAFVYTITTNILSNKIKTVEVVHDDDDKEILSTHLCESLSNIPLLQPDINVYTKKSLDIKQINVIDKELSTENDCTIVVLSNAVQHVQKLETAFRVGIEGSFVISREHIDADLSKLNSYNIEVTQDVIVGTERLLLLHKTCEKTTKHYIDLSNSVTSNFDWVKVLQETLKDDPNTILYSHGDDLTGLLGFVKCLRREPGKNNIRCVIVFDKDAPTFDPNDEFYGAQLKKGLALNVFKDGAWGQYIHMKMNEVEHVQAEHGYVNVTRRGDLSSLSWLKGSLSRSNMNHKIVDIYYAALNFRDVMTATGRIAPEYVAQGRFEQECVQGLEYSGRLSDGRRVMGIVQRGATSTMVAIDDVMTWDVPDHWTLQEAATVPCVYATVLFAFYTCSVKHGQTILIHSGAGGIGQAAINIARLMYHCTVFVTVGTPEKREFIKENWPEITDDYIGNSRDISFVQMIMKKTKGRGVDIVLNSLAEEKLQASVRCLAQGGCFIEIGKFDLSQDNPLSVKMFKKNCSFHGIMLDMLFQYSKIKKQYIHDLIESAIRDGYVKPLKSTVFERNQVEEAFRYMGSGKHMGKVLIRVREEEPNINAIPDRIQVEVSPRFAASSEGSYVVTGGLGGFGLELTDWLIMRGARKVLLNSRRGITSGYQSMRVKIWKSYGIDVIISTDDSTAESGCRRILEQANELGPVHGIFNLSVVLKDAIFENQSSETFHESLAPKAFTTKYLDEISREICPELRYFVIFSSVSCGRGNAGQTNYGMANAIMERICEKRREAGLPALAVEWGAVGDVGLVAQYQEESNTELVIGGTLQQPISNCLSTLDKFLTQDETIVSSIVVAEKKRGAAFGDNMIDAVISILGIKDIKTVSLNATLAEVGMDSIMGVEIKQTLERDFEVFLTPQDMRTMTFARLYEISRDKSTEKIMSDQEVNKDVIGNQAKDAGIFAMIRSVINEENIYEEIKVLQSQATSHCRERALLIPGIEAVANSLETLASQLNVVAICLQLSFNYNSDTVPELASELLQPAMDNLNETDDHFTIVGYSFGAIIALELASLLEAKGKVGDVILIDGSPDMLKQATLQEFNTQSEKEFENSVILHILKFMLTEKQIVYLKNLYENLPSWEEKMCFIIEYLPKEVEQKSKFLKDWCNVFYMRLKAILKYEPQFPKLKSFVKLIKADQRMTFSEEDDMGLSKFTINPVEIVEVEGTHLTVVNNIITANEINKMFVSEMEFQDVVGKEMIDNSLETTRN